MHSSNQYHNTMARGALLTTLQNLCTNIALLAFLILRSNINITSRGHHFFYFSIGRGLVLHETEADRRVSRVSEHRPLD